MVTNHALETEMKIHIARIDFTNCLIRSPSRTLIENCGPVHAQTDGNGVQPKTKMNGNEKQIQNIKIIAIRIPIKALLSIISMTELT